MLPLDKLDAEARDGFSSRGISEEDLDLCVELDLDAKGDFGTTWLAVDRKKMRFYVMSVTSDAESVYRKKKADAKAAAKAARKGVEEKEAEAAGLFRKGYFKDYDWTQLSNMYVDNYVSSNRLLGRIGEELEDPKDDDGREEEAKKPDMRETVVIAYCTNARKRKLFAFLDIVGRFKNKEDVAEDDPIFEQFHQKCPKCGRVYKDQNRRICEYCTNQSAVLKRLLGYFAKFKF